MRNNFNFLPFSILYDNTNIDYIFFLSSGEGSGISASEIQPSRMVLIFGHGSTRFGDEIESIRVLGTVTGADAAVQVGREGGERG